MAIRTFTSPRLKRISKTITFTGASGAGAVGSVTVFTVTGEILIAALVPSCTVDLVSAGGGDVALGVTSATTLFLGATTATAVDAGEFWVNTTPVANGVALPATFKEIITTDNIIITVGTADVTAGAIRFDMLYMPLSANGAVV